MTITIEKFLELIWFYAYGDEDDTMSFDFQGTKVKISIEYLKYDIEVSSIYALDHTIKKPIYFELSHSDILEILRFIYNSYDALKDLTDKISLFWQCKLEFKITKNILTVELENNDSTEISLLIIDRRIVDDFETIAKIDALNWAEISKLAFLTIDTVESEIVPLPIIVEDNNFNFSTIGSSVFISGHNCQIFFKTKYRNHQKNMLSDSFLVPNFAIIATSKYEVHEDVAIEYSASTSRMRLVSSDYEIYFQYKVAEDYDLGNMFQSLDKYFLSGSPLPDEYYQLDAELQEEVYLVKDLQENFDYSWELQPLVSADINCRIATGLWNDLVSFYTLYEDADCTAYRIGQDNYCFSLSSTSSELTILFTTNKQDQEFDQLLPVKIDFLTLTYQYVPNIFPHWDFDMIKLRFDQFTDFTGSWYDALTNIAFRVDIGKFEQQVEQVKTEYENLSFHNARQIDATYDYDDIIAEFKYLTDIYWTENLGSTAESYTTRHMVLNDITNFEELAIKISPAIDEITLNCQYVRTIILP